MTRASKPQIVRALLEHHGPTWSEELGLKLERGTPSVLFRWLCASILLSARISHRIAMKAARALADMGWTTPRKMADSTWEQRTKTLNESGYARYDERTSTMLGQSTDMLLNRYGGDLRRLREEADRDPEQERTLLKQFKGLGDVGVDIFFREVQVVWDELLPFADRKALTAAERLKLGRDARELARLVEPRDVPRLMAALVRADLNKDYDTVLRDAQQSDR